MPKKGFGEKRKDSQKPPLNPLSSASKNPIELLLQEISGAIAEFSSFAVNQAITPATQASPLSSQPVYLSS